MTGRSHRTPTWPPVIRGAFRLGLAVVAVVATACGRNGAPTLGGATRLAAGGDASWSEVADTLRSDEPDRDVRLDDLPLDEAGMLLPDSDPDDLTILFETAGSDNRLTASTSDGVIHDDDTAPVSSFTTQTAADITASGRFVSATDGDLQRSFTGELGAPDDILPEGPLIRTFDPVFVPVAEHPSPFPVGALDLADDGSILVGGLDESRVARIGRDGTTTHLLGPAGSDARVSTEVALGPVVAVLGLGDDRVAFVAGTDGVGRLFVVDDAGLRRVPDDSPDPNPVAGAGERRRPTFEESFPRPAMTPLAPSPDGRVLTTGVGRDGDPQIALVDVDTGDVEVLAVLDGVEPAVDEPISAVMVGDDLVFLAEHQLWRLPDVIDTR
jgi:hypothetical protein